MIGAVVIRFRVSKDGSLPVVNGRLAHAAFFARLREFSPDFSARLHDGLQQKPFSLSMLRPDKTLRPEHRAEKNTWCLREGEPLSFRIASVSEDILRAALSISAGETWHAGGLPLTVEEVICDSGKDATSGLLDEDELIARCLSALEIHEITIRFFSPTAFRTDDRDFPFPLPGFVFGSLVSKWNDAGFSAVFDKEEIKEIAETLPVRQWRGEARPVYQASDRGAAAFTGEATYDLRRIPVEMRKLFLLLAQFSTFSGIGRLTTQGFGQARTRYR